MKRLSKQEFLDLIESMPDIVTFSVSKHKEMFTERYFIHMSSDSCVATSEMNKLNTKDERM